MCLPLVMSKGFIHRFFNEWLRSSQNALFSSHADASEKVNLLGGDRSLNAGISIYRLQASEDCVNDVITIVCARDAELSKDDYLEDLDEQDLADLASCKTSHAYKRMAAGRVLRRKALTIAAAGDISAKDWTFEKTSDGKPYISDGLPKLSFSITHCDGATFVAVSPRYKIGIDAEIVDGVIEDALMSDVLSIREHETLKNLPEDKRKSRFFELWTLKEAYTKLTGTGLAVDLKQIAFELNSQSLDSIGHNLKARFLTWKTINGSSSCQIALALR